MKNMMTFEFHSLGDEQEMMLGEGCLYEIGTPVHEMMHAIGFFHEQSNG